MAKNTETLPHCIYWTPKPLHSKKPALTAEDAEATEEKHKPATPDIVTALATNGGSFLFSSNLLSCSAALGVLRDHCVEHFYKASRTHAELRSRSRITTRTRISAAAIA